MMPRHNTRGFAYLAVAMACLAFCNDLAWSQESSSDISQHVVVVLDDSGSMNEGMRSNKATSRMRAAKQSLTTVIDSLPADAQVGIVTLNGGWAIRLGPIDKDKAKKAIRSIGAKGGTPLGRYMKVGADALLTAREKDHYGSYRLLLVTDGEAGDQNMVEAYLPDILARGLTTDVIGVDMQSDHSLATKVHTYRRADDAKSLTQAVREVFAETSAASGDAGEDDFDLVSGLPDEVATAALEALAASGNHPIGEEMASANGVSLDNPNSGNAPGSNASTGASSSHAAAPAPPPWQTPAGQQRRGFRLFPLMVLLFFGFVAINIFKAVLRKS